VKITTPGIYDMPAAEYHADPCPTPSLSSSGAYTLANECPATFQHERSAAIYKRAFDIGTASHLMTLEPNLFEGHIVIVRGQTKDGKPSEGYTSQDAKDQRDAAYEAGKTPLLPKEAELVRAMRDVLLTDPIGRHAFRDGKAEQSIFWRDQEFGIWCRSRPDWIPTRRGYLINWKTAESSHPDDIQRAIYNLGYFQKCAWELDAVEAVTGERPEKYCLLVQSKKPPHLIVPWWVHPEDLAWGAVLNRYARGVFAWCSKNNHWPGYTARPNEAARAVTDRRMPPWALRQLEERHAAGEFQPPQDVEIAA